LTESCTELVHFTNVDEVMAAASGRGHEALVRRYHKWCLNNAESAITDAAIQGHETIVRLCLDEWGASDYVVRAMCKAARNGHEAIVGCATIRGVHPKWIGL
jgi:hypothetical protein